MKGVTPEPFVDLAPNCRLSSGVPAKTSALVDTRVIYCGDNLDQLRKLRDSQTARFAPFLIQ